MNDDTQEPMEMATKPLPEHEWLQKLVGEWKIANEMSMPDGSKLTSEGTASTKSLGGLWAVAEEKNAMPGGGAMDGYRMLGYDVSFKEYRGCMVMSASSHLWKYTGKLSDDGKTMTLDCEGPSMVKDGETARYVDVIELIDDDTYTVTSSGEDENGEMQQFAKATYTRA
jgi:hypothetical protein